MEEKNGNGTGLARVEATTALATSGVSTKVSLGSWADVVRFSEAMAKCPTGIIPKSYAGNAPAIAAAVMMGVEIGVHPMEALRSIYVVDGKPQLSAELMLKLAMRNGVTIQWLTSDEKTAHAKFTRPGHPPHEERFTWADAERAGVASKDVWKRYAKSMLRARCVSMALRAWAPDAIGVAGFYAEGEIGDAPETAAPAMIEATVVATPKQASGKAPTPIERLAACATPPELESWCDAYQAQVAGEPKRLARAVEKGAALGVPEPVVRQWLGLEPMPAPVEMDDGSLSEDPPHD